MTAGPELRIHVRLPDLIEAAKTAWGPLKTRRPLSVLQVTQGIQIHQHTVESYFDDTITRMQFDVIARICWFFGCSIDDVLTVGTGSDPLPPVTIGRITMPEHIPPVGGIRVLNFIPAEVDINMSLVRARTDWERTNILAMVRGGQRRVYRSTLETLLAVLSLARIRDLVEVQCDLDAVDPHATDLAAAVVIVEPRPTTDGSWDVTVERWRAASDVWPESGAVTAEDVAAARYLAGVLPEQFNGRNARLVMVLAKAMGITRALLTKILQGAVYSDISAEDVSPITQQILADVVKPNWHMAAAIEVARQYQR